MKSPWFTTKLIMHKTLLGFSTMYRFFVVRISLHLTRRWIEFKILSECANGPRIPTESTHMSHKSDSWFLFLNAGGQSVLSSREKCSRFKSWWSGLHSWQNFSVSICVFAARRGLAVLKPAPQNKRSLSLNFQQQQKKDRSACLLKNLLGKYWSALR